MVASLSSLNSEYAAAWKDTRNIGGLAPAPKGSLAKSDGEGATAGIKPGPHIFFEFERTKNARRPARGANHGSEAFERNSVLPDSAASHGVVDILDLTSHTLDQLPDMAPIPSGFRCWYCGGSGSHAPWCRSESSNVRRAVHVAHENGRGDGSWTGAEISPGAGA